MHTDARTLEDGSLIEGDLCIVGAGAAGIAMAREWAGDARRVVLLEGGGFTYEPRMQDLYRGESVGLPYYPLHAARLHYFGGTTGHWAGFCSDFDPIDFEPRAWVPHSGWPFRRATLDPFYARARRLLELASDEWGAEQWRGRDPSMAPLGLDARAMWTKMWQFSTPTRFGTRYRDDIVGARNVHLYTYANACEIEANESATAVTGLRVRTIEGKEHRVRARHYVLACSTIQNARLLLASNRRAAAGLGNGHDLVGRFFMEHLEMPSGQLALEQAHAARSLAMYRFVWGRTKGRGELALTAHAQREQRVLNATVSLVPATPGVEARSTFQNIHPGVVDRMRTRDTVTRPAAPPPDTAPAPVPTLFNLATRQEQAPNPDSRVTLSRETDALGMPRARLDWRLTSLDRHTFRGFYAVLGRELGRAGLGRARMEDWISAADDVWPASLGGGWHHMGTTRMHDDPRQGVVDANCRVHGVANLSVAGAAVFPTGGCANPTLTLVALSLRLSDHLKGKLSS